MHLSMLHAWESMQRARLIDEKMSKLIRQNKGGAFHLSANGHEMVGVMAALALKPSTDWAFPYYRDRAFALTLGCLPEDLFAALLAREGEHHSGGRMMPEHFSHHSLRIPCQSSCVGSQFLQAVGCAKGAQLRQAKEVVYVSAGEGATSQGDFHEALNFACLHQLPILFVIQNNGWAISVPVKEQTTGGSIATIAQSYPGLVVHDVDGGDYQVLANTFAQTVTRARDELGPSLIVAHVPRLGAHSSSDDPRKYRKEKDLIQEQERDPLARFTQHLLGHHIVSEDELKARIVQLQEEVNAAAIAAEQRAFPARKTATEKLFAPFEVSSKESAAHDEPIVMMDALHHALVEEMERDPGVVVFGQDVAHGKGGVFGITRGLTERFSVRRCFNTPLAESTIMGLALGLSLDGHHRPVAEIQFADYVWTGINQLFNEIATFYYRSNGEWNCPIVIRMPYGGYIQGGPYHSQSIEAFLCHCPGLKVVIPSHAADAKRLLKTAIRDPNPVIFLEHKGLYRQRLFCARPEPGVDELLPFGQASVVRAGSDVTVVAWGMAVLMAHEVAEELKSEQISVELLDLRTLVPCDFAAVLSSLKKTGKLLIVHEAARTCGFGAELAARASEEGFSYLDAPIVRVTGADTPVPYCKDLEEEILPHKKNIAEAIRKLARF